MNDPIREALRRAVVFLEENGYRYAVIGGVANALWGIPRATLDVDIKVLIEEGRYAEFAGRARREFTLRPTPVHNPLIVTVFATEQVGVDFLLGVPGYEDLMFERAVRRRLDDFEVWVCTPEDLIIHKAIANRPKDWSDIEGVLIERMDHLDYAYIDDWLDQFAQALDQPEIVIRYQELRDSLALRSVRIQGWEKAEEA